MLITHAERRINLILYQRGVHKPRDVTQQKNEINSALNYALQGTFWRYIKKMGRVSKHAVAAAQEFLTFDRIADEYLGKLLFLFL